MSDKKFDKEYATTYLKEKLFLDACGIRYAFVKQENGITYFKYKKTQKLFESLAIFYAQFE